MTDPLCPTCEAPFFNNAVICPACRNRLEQYFAETDSLLDDLDVTLTKQSQTRSHGGTGELDDTPTPFHVGASNAGENLARIYMSWAALVQDELGRPYVGRPTARDAASYLLHHVDWLANHEAAPDCFNEVAAACRRIERVIDIDPERRFIGVCGADVELGPCDEILWAFEGRDTVQCRLCGTLWDAKQRRLQTYLDATDWVTDGPTLTRAFFKDGIALTTGQIRTWAARGFLTPERPRRYVVAHVARLVRMSAAGERLTNIESEPTP